MKRKEEDPLTRKDLFAMVAMHGLLAGRRTSWSNITIGPAAYKIAEEMEESRGQKRLEGSSSGLSIEKIEKLTELMERLSSRN